MNLRFPAFFLFLFVTFTISLAAEVRKAEDIFKKWLSWQKIQDEVKYIPALKDTAYARYVADTMPESIRDQVAFLQLPKRTDIPKNPDMKKSLEALKVFHGKIEGDKTKLFKYLIENKFSTSATNEKEDSQESSAATEKYKSFYESIFAEHDHAKLTSKMFSFSVDLFDASFRDPGFQQFHEYLNHEEYYSICRMVYANVWYQLSGNGWRYWHRKTLDKLKAEARSGREIVYIAGGSDIYQLLMSGIYTIRVIDPMFPSQTKYYSEGWEYLLKGNLKDEIVFTYPEIKLVRTAHQQSGTFTTDELSDHTKVNIPRSTTEWTVYNYKGKVIGKVTYERRFVEQKDFQKEINRAVLISFNELYFIASDRTDSWGIDPEKFDSELRVYVKQLKDPVHTSTIINIRKAIRSDFSYIKLGTSVN